MALIHHCFRYCPLKKAVNTWSTGKKN